MCFQCLLSQMHESVTHGHAYVRKSCTGAQNACTPLSVPSPFPNRKAVNRTFPPCRPHNSTNAKALMLAKILFFILFPTRRSMLKKRKTSNRLARHLCVLKSSTRRLDIDSNLIHTKELELDL